MSQWAIMVCLDGKDDWIYITEQTEHCWDIKPLLFDDVHEALDAAEQWVVPGKESNVTVVNYEEEN